MPAVSVTIYILFVAGSLGGEKGRWSETAKCLRGTLHNVIGDVLLAAGAIAYLGPFTVNFRQVCFLTLNGESKATVKFCKILCNEVNVTYCQCQSKGI
jgi:hypothetical protein